VKLPDPVRASVEAEISALEGRATAIVEVAPLGGGCVSLAARIKAETGLVAFLKWAHDATSSLMFEQEARSLDALRTAGSVRIPVVLGRGDSADAPWLMLEWLEPGRPSADTWAQLGRALARLHAVRGAGYGWDSDNFIGSLPQQNTWSDDWAVFWRERRLLPQLRLAYNAGYFNTSERRRFEKLLERLDVLLEAARGDGPSLLHGDLWSGNVHVLTDGQPALIDPSAYYGHREVDLAMSELFGGFQPDYMRAYSEVWPVEAGYQGARRAVYQLYYLLVHVNMFGASYVPTALSTLGRITLN
jgi:protein-ribulosamine 3-kinase